jgi:predicted transcriptional regulator of viral defense system
MRNNNNYKIREIFEKNKNLPFFTLDTLLPIETNRDYLKIMLSRAAKSGEIVRLKKGIYVTKYYLEKARVNQKMSSYSEFLANNIYRPSYLSLEYVLYENNMLTEVPINYTSVAMNKTANFTNSLGNFFYQKIKKDLFVGFFIELKDDYLVGKATKAKALFDFLYLRKSILVNKESIQELRLNMSVFGSKDKKEFERYVKIDKSSKMNQIFHYVFE